jgi:hypothetical protein
MIFHCLARMLLQFIVGLISSYDLFSLRQSSASWGFQPVGRTRSVFFLCPVLKESEYSWPLAEMMVGEAVVAETKDHKSRRHHYPHLMEKEDPQEPLYSQ